MSDEPRRTDQPEMTDHPEADPGLAREDDQREDDGVGEATDPTDPLKRDDEKDLPGADPVTSPYPPD